MALIFQQVVLLVRLRRLVPSHMILEQEGGHKGGQQMLR
jgi:hypothetical protein